MRPRGERGVALLAVLMYMTMIVVLTAALMNVVQADVATGIRQQQAVQVFNMAEAGVHYAIARLQISGADTYTGETRSISDGSTTVGTATMTVRCLDGTLPTVNSCSGANAGYRRITSTGSLAVAGPLRAVTAIVEGTTSSTSTYAICSYNGVSFDQGTTVYGNVGSNANITLARGGTPSRICNSQAGGACPAPIPPPSQSYSGSAYAVGDITCGGGACNSSQIEGTVARNQPPGSVCPPNPFVSNPPPALGGSLTDLVVDAGQTVTLNPATDYGYVTLRSSGSAATAATLIIDSGADPNATVTVRMRNLWIGRYARVVIIGTGKVSLWLLEGARQALHAEQQSVFGSTTTALTPVAIAGDRFTVGITSTKVLGSSGDCLTGSGGFGGGLCPAVHFNQSGLISGTFLAPYAGFELDQAQLTNGAILCNGIQFDSNTTFTWDPRSRIGSNSYGNFNELKSWKDQ